MTKTAKRFRGFGLQPGETREEWLSQFGTYPTEEEAKALRDAVDFANAQLAKIGMGPYLCILPGYPYGAAVLVSSPDTEPSGKAHVRDREQSDDPVAAVRRLLVRTLWRNRYR